MKRIIFKNVSGFCPFLEACALYYNKKDAEHHFVTEENAEGVFEVTLTERFLKGYVKSETKLR